MEINFKSKVVESIKLIRKWRLKEYKLGRRIFG
jgi:hypothetical protein